MPSSAGSCAATCWTACSGRSPSWRRRLTPSGWTRRSWEPGYGLESLRLVLGTRLDVTEAMLAHDLDPADPRLPELELYGYLSWLQEQAVEALSAGLP